MAEYWQETIEMLGRIVKGVITDVEAGFQRPGIDDDDVVVLWTNGIAALVHLADALLKYKVLVKYFSSQEVVERISDGMMYLPPMVLRLDSATHSSTKLCELWLTTKILDQEYERLGIDGFKMVRERESARSLTWQMLMGQLEWPNRGMDPDRQDTCYPPSTT